MGQAHLICVRDDGLKFSPPTDLPTQVGAAVVHMCTATEVYFPADRGTPGKVAAIGAMTNCIEHVDHVHSSDRRLYLWIGNCLRPLHEVNVDDLHVAQELLAAEMQCRQG